MFPCCSRVCCSCCSPYSLVDGTEEIELQEVSSDGNDSVDGAVAVAMTSSSDSEEEDVTVESVETDGVANSGLFSAEGETCLASIGYGILRICDYFQLYCENHLSSQGIPARVRRDIHGMTPTTRPIYSVGNASSFNLTSPPQWIYPCSITPNATFPNGRQPFSSWNSSSGVYDLLTRMNYTAYFNGDFDQALHTLSDDGHFLLDANDSEDGYLGFPYGIKGNGDMILRHFGNFTPQYPYSRFGISNESFYNGTSLDCPRWIFNATHFFSGGYLGLEDPGFSSLYPCGIHPDGLFTGEWIRGLNSAIPPNGSYPFGYFSNGTFPYVDYFFNPDFNHAALYWAVQRGDIHALQNYTRFVNSTETPLHYHPLPTNYTEPFASCYGYFPPHTNTHVQSVALRRNSSGEDVYFYDQGPGLDPNLRRAAFWLAQVGAETGMFVTQTFCPGSRKDRLVKGMYLGIRAANMIHSVIDLCSNVSDIANNGLTDDRGQSAAHNMLALTDIVSFTTDAIHFCTPAIKRLQECVSQGTGANCFRNMCSSAQNVGQIVRRSMSKLTAIAGAVGVACTAAMGAALTADLINNDDQNTPEQKAILGAQIAVAAAATWALGWIARANTRASEQ